MARKNMKKKFYEHMSKRPKRANSFQMSAAKYAKLVEDVKVAKSGMNKENRHYWLLKHYDVITVHKKAKLIFPSPKEIGILYYVALEDVFDILYDTHASIGHGGRDRMRTEIHHRYKNITVQDIQAFLNLCETCIRKKRSEKRDLQAIKPLIVSRSEVDLVDFRARADGEFNFVLIFQDHLTKFVILRALKSNQAAEVAEQLLDIFLLFGAPSILQTENGGKELVKAVIERLKKMWPEVKIISGKNFHGSQSRRCIASVERMVKEWMEREKCASWSKGLGLVQFEKNRTFLAELKTSPYEAMFGQPAKVGLESSSLSDELLRNLNTEEELENVLWLEAQKQEFQEEDDDGQEKDAKHLRKKTLSTEKITVDVDDMSNEEL